MNKIPPLDEEKLQKIPINECNDPLIDLKDQNEIAYGNPPDTPLTRNDYTKVRQIVYTKLCKAQKNLPSGWKFRVYEGLRSLNVQKVLFEQQYKNVQAISLGQSDEDIYKKTSLLIAPVIFFNGKPNTPPHSTGGAIDVEIIDSEKNLVDFGMAIKDWNKIDPDICNTVTDKISQIAAKNREILLQVMCEQGFVNYPYEWWHFSYGDRLWAYLTNQEAAIFAGIKSTI